MSGTDIFLSYSRADRAAARHFADSFTNEGFTVWWDAALRSGQTFDEVIEEQLRAAKAVVVLWSPRSVASRWVRAEATLADRRNKLVPAIIEACDRPIIFELTHAADLADWTGDTSDPRWQTLVHDLRRLVDGAAKEAESTPAAPRAVQPKSTSTLRGPSKSDRFAPRDAAEELPAAPPRRADVRAGSSFFDAEPEQPDETDLPAVANEPTLSLADEFHCLERIDSDGPESRFVVTPEGLKIGRTTPADIILADSGVSRSHCVVELAGHQVRVLDMNSTNGTYVDFDRIDGAAVLPVGSVLRVGKVSFTHEVRTRAELQWQHSPASFDRGSSPRPVKLARTS